MNLGASASGAQNKEKVWLSVKTIQLYSVRPCKSKRKKCSPGLDFPEGSKWKKFSEVGVCPHLDIQPGLLFDFAFERVFDALAYTNTTAGEMVLPGVAQSHEQDVCIPHDDGIG